MDVLQRWPWEDKVEKSLPNLALAFPLCGLWTTSPSHLPESAVAAQITQGGTPERTLKQHRGPAYMINCQKQMKIDQLPLSIHCPPLAPQYSFPDECQPRQTASSHCCVTIKKLSVTVNSLESMRFCGSWTLCPRTYHPCTSVFPFPTIHVDWSLAFGPCSQTHFQKFRIIFSFQRPCWMKQSSWCTRRTGTHQNN